MLAELQVRMRDAAKLGATKAPTEATGAVIFGASLNEILMAVLEKARELGREYREPIESAAKNAIDALVAKDIPGLPAALEAYVDEAAREIAYDAIEVVLDAVLGLAA